MRSELFCKGNINMPKKCPPGIICIENMTLVFLFFIFGLIGYIIYNHQNTIVMKEQRKQRKQRKQILMSTKRLMQQQLFGLGIKVI